MSRPIIFIFIPVLIGWAIGKSNKREGPGCIIGFLIGMVLYAVWLSNHGGPPSD